MALDKGKRRLLEKEVTQEGTVYKMTVRDIAMKDFGDIILKANNMVSESVAPCIFQIVQIKPSIIADFPKMQECKEGAEFILTAKIDGSSPPTAVWLLEGEEIEADGERVIITHRKRLMIALVSSAHLRSPKPVTRTTANTPCWSRTLLERPSLTQCLMLWANPRLPR